MFCSWEGQTNRKPERSSLNLHGGIAHSEHLLAIRMKSNRRQLNIVIYGGMGGRSKVKPLGDPCQEILLSSASTVPSPRTALICRCNSLWRSHLIRPAQAHPNEDIYFFSEKSCGKFGRCSRKIAAPSRVDACLSAIRRRLAPKKLPESAWTMPIVPHRRGCAA